MSHRVNSSVIDEAIKELMVEWQKFGDKILLKTRSYNAVAADSLPISLSVRANNYQPTLYAFDIAALNRDSTGYVIDVTRFLTSDVKAFSGLNADLRRTYKVSRLDDSRSFVQSAKSFPLNIEVRQDFTFDAAEPPSNSETGAISVLVNQSMVLLPRVPMQPRINDFRIDYFNIRQYDYGSEALKADEKSYIRRWKLVLRRHLQIPVLITNDFDEEAFVRFAGVQGWTGVAAALDGVTRVESEAAFDLFFR